MSYGDAGSANAQRCNGRIRGIGRAFGVEREYATGRRSTRDGGNPKPLMAAVRRLELTLTACGGRKRVAQILCADDSGSGLILDGGDVDLHRSRCFVPLHAPDGGAAIGSGGNHFGAQAGVEDTGSALAGETEADRCHVHRLAGFVGNQNRDAVSSASACAVGDAVAIDHAQLNDDRGVSRNSKCEGAAKQASKGLDGLG